MVIAHEPEERAKQSSSPWRVNEVHMRFGHDCPLDFNVRFDLISSAERFFALNQDLFPAIT